MGRIQRRAALRATLIASALVALVLAVPVVASSEAAAAGPGITLTPCTLAGGVRATCGWLAVPENPRRPAGKAIRLRVAVLPARVKPALGALFFIAGGPGGSAVDAATVAALEFGGVGVARDIVLVDQRGTGGSARLTCTPPAGGAAALSDPAQVRAFAHSCVAGLGTDPGLYMTDIAMDDLELVRRALGYGRIDLYGGSYGATAALVFLARHPASVRAVVLDGATLPSIHIFERWGSNGQRALDLQLARCAASKPCRTAFPDPAGDLRRLLERLRAKPATVTVPGSGSIRFDAAAAQAAVQVLTRTPEGAAEIPFDLRQAARGDLQPLAGRYAVSVLAERAALGTTLMYWAIVCAEPWARRDPALAARDAARSYLVDAVTYDSALTAAVCSEVPKRQAPPELGRIVPSKAPILFLVGGADPQDPVSGLEGARAAFPAGRIADFSGVGHIAMPYGCARVLVEQFVREGSAARLDTACAAHVALPPFLVSPG